MGSSDRVKKAVAGYFNDPRGTATLVGTTMTGTGETVTLATNDSNLEKLKDKLEEEIKAKKDLEKLAKQIEITITPEGLRIELLEGRNATFFESGSARLSGSGQELLALLAAELKTLPNSLLIEGHTDAAKYSNGANYGNWGTLRRPRQLRAPPAPAEWRALRSGHPGARLCRSAFARQKQPLRPLQPAHLAPRQKRQRSGPQYPAEQTDSGQQARRYTVPATSSTRRA